MMSATHNAARQPSPPVFNEEAAAVRTQPKTKNSDHTASSYGVRQAHYERRLALMQDCMNKLASSQF